LPCSPENVADVSRATFAVAGARDAMDLGLSAAGGGTHGQGAALQFAELGRRSGWEFNGMRLHELYLDGMTARVRSMDAVAPSLRRQTGTGSGSAWIDEHHVGHLAGCPILLVMDVSEHAFTCDYGTKKADSIEASFAAAKPPDTKKG
jgi:hypothetical protein